MKTFFVGALSASVLFGSTVAFAQGLPESPPVYGSVWTANKLRAEHIQAAGPNTHQARDVQGVKPQMAGQSAGTKSASGG